MEQGKNPYYLTDLDNLTINKSNSKINSNLIFLYNNTIDKNS